MTILFPTFDSVCSLQAHRSFLNPVSNVYMGQMFNATMIVHVYKSVPKETFWLSMVRMIHLKKLKYSFLRNQIHMYQKLRKILMNFIFQDLVSLFCQITQLKSCYANDIKRLFSFKNLCSLLRAEDIMYQICRSCPRKNIRLNLKTF